MDPVFSAVPPGDDRNESCGEIYCKLELKIGFKNRVCLGKRFKQAEQGGCIWEQVERGEWTMEGNCCWKLKAAMGLSSHYQPLFTVYIFIIICT